MESRTLAAGLTLHIPYWALAALGPVLLVIAPHLPALHSSWLGGGGTDTYWGVFPAGGVISTTLGVLGLFTLARGSSLAYLRYALASAAFLLCAFAFTIPRLGPEMDEAIRWGERPAVDVYPDWGWLCFAAAALLLARGVVWVRRGEAATGIPAGPR